MIKSDTAPLHVAVQKTVLVDASFRKLANVAGDSQILRRHFKPVSDYGLIAGWQYLSRDCRWSLIGLYTSHTTDG